MVTTSINPYAPPYLNNPMAISEELQKAVKAAVERTLIDVIENPSSDLQKHLGNFVEKVSHCPEMIEKISKKLSKHIAHDNEHYEHVENEMELFWDKINHYHKCLLDKSKNIREIEAELFEKHDKLDNNERRVLSCILRGDGPVHQADMLGIDLEEYINIIKSLGKHLSE